MKPPLKFPGGKRWLIPTLEPIWNQHKDKRLVEPFCGALSVSLGLQPDMALLNDINPHIINFFTWIKKGIPTVRLPMLNNKEFYYQYRDEFNSGIKKNKINSRKSAEYFYYLNRTGYNGLCRFNNSGLYNVPFGSYKTINYASSFISYKPSFKNWELSCKDFSKIPLQQSDFIYADPPFDVPFTKYSKEDFKWDDQIRLAYWLSKHKGPVVTSNHATERIVDLYKSLGFCIQLLNAPRKISCTGNRDYAKEILAVKNI